MIYDMIWEGKFYIGSLQHYESIKMNITFNFSVVLILTFPSELWFPYFTLPNRNAVKIYEVLGAHFSSV